MIITLATLKKKNFTMYWNKVYEPDFLKFDSINGGFIGEYLGIPTVEIEGMKSMIIDPEKKKKYMEQFKVNNTTN